MPRLLTTACQSGITPHPLKGGSPLTEKELHRMKRADLLALLLAQGREAATLQTQLDSANGALADSQELVARLKTRLDEKDAQMERLKGKLNEKDAQLDRLKSRLDAKDARIVSQAAQIAEYTSGRFLNMENVSSLNEITRRVEMVMAAAQNAAVRFLQRMAQQDQPAADGAEPASAASPAAEQPERLKAVGFTPASDVRPPIIFAEGDSERT